MHGKFKGLQKELVDVRQAAVAAHIAGDKAKAECLTGKAVGMKSTLEIAERAFLEGNDHSAVGELEGMQRVIASLQPLKRCA
jgi:hypothetical protein